MAGGRGNPDDVDISIKLKYGKHTIFMFANPLEPFSKITDELLFILREQYATTGLHASRDSPTTVPIPAEGEEVHVAYAVLKTPSDPSQGLKSLRIKGNEKPADLKIKNNTVVAFVLQAPDEVDETPVFEVEFPDPDEEMAE